MVGDPEIYYNEPERIHTTNDGVVYKRTGYCCQCGECCKGCPALAWVVENVRSVCGDRLKNVSQ